MERTATKSFNGGKLADAKDTIDRIILLMKKMTPMGCLPLPRGYIHVYDHYYQTSSPLKTAWSIKAKFYVEPPWEGGTKVCINGPGHMTKMAAIPIHVYGKNL